MYHKVETLEIIHSAHKIGLFVSYVSENVKVISMQEQLNGFCDRDGVLVLSGTK